MEQDFPAYTINDEPHEGFGFIYKLTSPSGKSYIGQTTKSAQNRFLQHCNNNKCINIHNAIAKYDKKSFSVEILGHFLLDILSLAEIIAIKEYNTLAPNGYNLTGGGGYWMDSFETRKKKSKAVKNIWSGRTKQDRYSIIKKGRYNMSKDELASSSSKGWKNMSEEARKQRCAKISKSNKGKKLAPEIIAKMKMAHKNMSTKKKKELSAKRSVNAKNQWAKKTLNKKAKWENKI